MNLNGEGVYTISSNISFGMFVRFAELCIESTTKIEYKMPCENILVPELVFHMWKAEVATPSRTLVKRVDGRTRMFSTWCYRSLSLYLAMCCVLGLPVETAICPEIKSLLFLLRAICMFTIKILVTVHWKHLLLQPG